MLNKKVEDKAFRGLFPAFCLSIIVGPIISTACLASERLVPQALTGLWDPNRYISVDEIQPEMEAYCLTCYKGTDIEKFELDIVSVVRNIEPDRDAILVMGTDERFIRTGPVGGCSGSPVYIDGRLAGALAFGWYFSKDPLYGVTPIEEMLAAGQFDNSEQTVAQSGLTFDFSRPIDLVEIDKQITSLQLSNNKSAGVSPLPCPLITSGLPAEARRQLEAFVEPFGLMVVAGINGGGQSSPGDTNDISEIARTKEQSVPLEPGAVLTIPLISGDISMFALGTATEVIDGKVYGFGHSFLGRGPIDVPMATGKVHTVMSSMSRSFKLGSTLDIVGALRADESAAIVGQIGEQAKMIPLTIKVDRYNDSQERVYNCRIVHDQTITPIVLATAVNGAVSYVGNFPPDHTVEYKVMVKAEQTEPIIYQNVSTGVGVNDMLLQSRSLVALLMNNPFKEVDIESLDFEVRILPKNIVSHIWSAELSDTKVKAGEIINVKVIVESFLAGKKKHQFNIQIPDDMPPGIYSLTVCGSQNYSEFLRNSVPYKFLAQSFPSMIEAINNTLQIRNDKLYCILTLPSSGLALEKAELPDLPATKALVLQNGKRSLRTQPYRHWIEKTVDTGTIIIDKKVASIIVKK